MGDWQGVRGFVERRRSHLPRAFGLAITRAMMSFCPANIRTFVNCSLHVFADGALAKAVLFSGHAVLCGLLLNR